MILSRINLFYINLFYIEMAKLYLVRHAHTEEENMKKESIHMGRTIHGHLSEKGRFEANRLGERLKNENFSLIVCSNLRRTKRSIASLLSSNTSTPVVFTEELSVMDIGSLSGLPKEKYPLTWDGSEIRDDQGEIVIVETKKQMRVRALKILKRILTDYPEDKILFCVHNGIGLAIEGIIMGYTIEEQMSMPKFENASISIYAVSKLFDIEKEAERTNITNKTVIRNDISHLESSCIGSPK